MNFLHEHTVDTAITVIYNNLAIFRLTAWENRKRKVTGPDFETGEGDSIVRTKTENKHRTEGR